MLCILAKLFQDPKFVLCALFDGGGAILKFEYGDVLVREGGIENEDCCVIVLGPGGWPRGSVDVCDWEDHRFEAIADGVFNVDQGFAVVLLGHEDVFAEDQPIGLEAGFVCGRTR